MQQKDCRDIAWTAGSAESVDRLDAAIDLVLSFRGNPIKLADESLSLDPSLIGAHILKANAFAFSLHPRLRTPASAALDGAATMLAEANEREKIHISATRCWLDGDFDGAATAFDRILERWPADLMAAMFAHQADFFGGHEAALLHRPTSLLERWPDELPGRSFLLGMRAFGLEEASRYAEAEELGREAVRHEPKDVWAIHAVAHVLEMQGRDEEGESWYARREADWSQDCFFAVHNWWHRALFHLDTLDHAKALEIYDHGLAPDRRSITLNLCDAAALLWRLHLADVDIGGRAPGLATLFAAQIDEPSHIFNDVHAAFAFATAERLDLLETLDRNLERRSQRRDTYGRMLILVGRPLVGAIRLFAMGRHDACADALVPLLPVEHLMTGSHAQRDLLPLTLIEASIRAGRAGAARALLEPRQAAKPASKRIARDLARC